MISISDSSVNVPRGYVLSASYTATFPEANATASTLPKGAGATATAFDGTPSCMPTCVSVGSCVCTAAVRISSLALPAGVKVPAAVTRHANAPPASSAVTAVESPLCAQTEQITRVTLAPCPMKLALALASASSSSASASSSFWNRGSSSRTSRNDVPASTEAKRILAVRPETPTGSHVHEAFPALTRSKPPDEIRTVVQRCALGMVNPRPTLEPSAPTTRHARTYPSLDTPTTYSPSETESHLAANRSGPCVCITSAWRIVSPSW